MKIKNSKERIGVGLTLILAVLCSGLDAQNIKINEVLYDPIGADTGKEWIELYNADSVSINLEGWKIQKAGTSFSTCFTFPEITIVPGEFLLIGEEEVENADLIATLAFYNNGSRTDGIRIIRQLADGDTIDTILYGEPNNNGLPGDDSQPGTHFAPDVKEGCSLIRFPDGYDTDNCETDFSECASVTPGMPNCNISLDSLSVLPSHPDTTDNVSVVLFIKNLADASLQPGICNYKVLIDSNLVIEGSVEEEIPANETLAYNVLLGTFNLGLHNLKAYVFPHNFISSSYNVISTSFLVGETPIIINEIMFYPGEEIDKVEWVEVYNRSDTSLSLSGWHITDATMKWKQIITSKELSPDSYGVIVREGDTLAIADYYGGSILFSQTDGWPILNNDEDKVLLGDSYCTVIDSAAYSSQELDCIKNYSIERINPFEDLPDNWGVSEDSLGATPGQINSLTPRDYDLSATSLIYTESEETLQLLGVCKNIGFNDITDAEFLLFNDANFNNTAESEEILGLGFFSLSVGDSCEFYTEWTIPQEGYYQFGFNVNVELDMNPNNNIIFTTYNSPGNSPIAINEIQFAPKGDEPEWLELYQNFSYPLKMKDWQLSLKGTFISFSHIESSCQPEEYIIIVPDTADIDYLKAKYSLTPGLPLQFLVGLPNLHNTDDILVIQDRFGTILDSIHYYASWSEEREGHSLERVNPDIPTNNPDNWEYSVHPNQATPGRQNSIYIETLSPEISLSITPNPVSLKKNHAVVLEYNLPEVLSKVNIRIFDVKGRLIRWLSDQEFCAAQGEIIWDCKDDNGNVVPVGIYIVYMEAVGRQTRKVFQETATMVVGEK